MQNLKKLNFWTFISSSEWRERKEALELIHAPPCPPLPETDTEAGAEVEANTGEEGQVDEGNSASSLVTQSHSSSSSSKDTIDDDHKNNERTQNGANEYDANAYNDLISVLQARCLDTNVHVRYASILALKRVSNHLKNHFRKHALRLCPILLRMFKEKTKSMVVGLDGLLDQLYATCFSLEHVLKNVLLVTADSKKSSNQSKATNNNNPLIQLRSLEWLKRCMESDVRRSHQAHPSIKTKPKTSPKSKSPLLPNDAQKRKSFGKTGGGSRSACSSPCTPRDRVLAESSCEKEGAIFHSIGLLLVKAFKDKSPEMRKVGSEGLAWLLFLLHNDQLKLLRSPTTASSKKSFDRKKKKGKGKMMIKSSVEG